MSLSYFWLVNFLILDMLSIFFYTFASTLSEEGLSYSAPKGGFL